MADNPAVGYHRRIGYRHDRSLPAGRARTSLYGAVCRVIEPLIEPSSDALVTTVIPTYRRPALLKRAIESVLGQTAGTQRIAVYDNASGDDTGAVVLDIARRDPRVRYHRQAANLGSFENFRLGLAEVSTPFFSLLSDDDVLLPRFYETALSALRQHPTALFAVTRVLQVDRTGHLLSIEGRSWSPGLHGPRPACGRCCGSAM